MTVAGPGEVVAGRVERLHDVVTRHPQVPEPVILELKQGDEHLPASLYGDGAGELSHQRGKGADRPSGSKWPLAGKRVRHGHFSGFAGGNGGFRGSGDAACIAMTPICRLAFHNSNK